MEFSYVYLCLHVAVDMGPLVAPRPTGPEHSKSFNLPLFKVTNNSNSPNLKQAMLGMGLGIAPWG